MTRLGIVNGMLASYELHPLGAETYLGLALAVEIVRPRKLAPHLLLLSCYKIYIIDQMHLFQPDGHCATTRMRRMTRSMATLFLSPP